jgi:hypothetical protein
MLRISSGTDDDGDGGGNCAHKLATTIVDSDGCCEVQWYSATGALVRAPVVTNPDSTQNEEVQRRPVTSTALDEVAL